MATSEDPRARILPMVRPDHNSPRAIVSAAKGVARAAAESRRRREVGVKSRPHPATSEPDYTANQLAFLRAVDEFRRQSNRRFLDLTDYLEIAESIGWERRTGTWPSDRVADRIEAVENASAVA